MSLRPHVRACVRVRDRLNAEAERGRDTKAASPHVIRVRTFVSQRDFNEASRLCVLLPPPADVHWQPRLGYKKCMCVFFVCVCVCSSKYSVTLVLCMQTVCIYARARCCCTRGCAQPIAASCRGQYIRVRQSTSEQLLQVRFITTALGPLLWQWIPYLCICLCVCACVFSYTHPHPPLSIASLLKCCRGEQPLDCVGSTLDNS